MCPCPAEGTGGKHMQNNDDLREMFGPKAVFTRIGAITLVHLDHPSLKDIRERIAQAQRETKEPADCPLCELVRRQGGYTIVYQ